MSFSTQNPIRQASVEKQQQQQPNKEEILISHDLIFICIMGKSTRCSPVREARITPSAPGHFLSMNQALSDVSKGMPRERPLSFKPELHPPSSPTFSGNSTYSSDFYNQSPPRSPTRAPRPRDNFQPNPPVAGAYATTNMTVNSVISNAYANNAVHRPLPILKSDHGPLNAPTAGLDTSRSTYRSEFYAKPMTRGSSPNRRFVTSPVVQTSENRDFLTSNGATFHRSW